MDTPSEAMLKCAEIDKGILDLKAAYRQSIEEKLESATPLIESTLNGYIHQVGATFECFHLHKNIGRSDTAEEKLNNDENECVNPKVKIRELIEEASMSVTSSLESRMDEFIPPVFALFDKLLTEKYIGRSDVQDDVSCRREKLSISRLGYGDLDFLRENKEEEMFYSNKNFTGLIAKHISNSKKINTRHLKMAPSHYLSDVELDTSVIQEFCHLLSNIFEEKNVEFIDPLCWQSRLNKVHDKSKSKPAKKFDKVLIGVLEDAHFFSIHVHVTERQIFIMDSIDHPLQFYEKHLTNLVEYMLFHNEIGVEQWRFIYVCNSPQQNNEIDCGVFMLKNMEFWAKGEKLPFTQGANVAKHILMLEVVEEKLADDEMINEIFSCPKNPAQKLLILDVNGLLADILDEKVIGKKHNSRIKRKYVYLRPNFKQFIEFCFKNFQVAIWSSRSRENLHTFIKDHLSEFKFLFIWCNEECDEAGHFRNSRKPVFFKKLQKVWDKWPCYTDANTLLIDDSPYKGGQNIEGTSIFPKPFSCKASDNHPLEPGSELWNYLDSLANATHVSKYVKVNRYGAPHLSEEDPFWKEVVF